MSKIFKIAITGVGGGVGQSIIKSFNGTDYTLLSLDGEALGAGLYASPTAYIIPYASKENYIDELIRICKVQKIDILFPGMDAELPKLAKSVELFQQIGTKVIISRPEIIEIADDKLLTSLLLKELDLPFPITFNLTEYLNDISVLDFPVIIKPRVGGFRSKEVYKIFNAADLDKVKISLAGSGDNYVAQQYIEGDEYTCGTVYLENECAGVIVMRRILRDGDTYKCFVENNSEIEKVVRKIVNHLKPFGAFNIQLRLKDGIPFVFELNARCSGTTASRSLCGFNEPTMIADFLLKNIKPSYQIQEKTVLRYWKEILLDNETINTIKSHKVLQNNQIIHL